MYLSDFDFELPNELIAQHPAMPRDSSKMLVIDKNKFTSHHFYDLPNFLSEKDLVICNNTKVMPSKLYGKRNTKSIQVTLHKFNDDGSWSAFARPAKKLIINDIIQFGSLKAEIIEKLDGGEIKLSFKCEKDNLIRKLIELGKMPLPPYIKRNNDLREDDDNNYQTIYADKLGAFAAPTAGLHFTNKVFDKLQNLRINVKFVTLHVGAGTFLPVKTENINNHKMHSEWGEVTSDVVEKILECKKNGGKILTVGTTTLRLVETAFDKKEKRIKPFSGYTNIFIKPGYKFNVSDLLLTNFHLPKSTLLMLVAAFGGYNNLKKAYQYAIDNQYRFFSYGDCCLIKKNNEKL